MEGTLSQEYIHHGQVLPSHPVKHTHTHHAGWVAPHWKTAVGEVVVNSFSSTQLLELTSGTQDVCLPCGVGMATGPLVLFATPGEIVCPPVSLPLWLSACLPEEGRRAKISVLMPQNAFCSSAH